MTIDVDRARVETPGCRDVAHFNNAGAALMPRCVIDAVTAHLDAEVHRGGYEAAAAAQPARDRAYAAAADLINADADEIALVENATVGWCMAFYGIAETFEAGDRILTAEAEYAANYVAYLQMAKRRGLKIDVVPSDDTGALSARALADMIDDRVKLISITHVPTNGGLINPAEEVGRIARDAGIPYLLDACQSVGQFPVDVDAIGCDMLSVTGRKYLRGPRGTGFLYVRSSILESFEPPIIDHSAAPWVAPGRYELLANARRFENWENNIAAQIGLATALDYALGWGIDAIGQRNFELARNLRQALDAIPGVTVRDLGEAPGAIVTFSVDGVDPAAVKSALAACAINVSVTNAHSTRLDMEKRGLDALVRASVHYYNSAEEIELLAEAVEGLV